MNNNLGAYKFCYMCQQEKLRDKDFYWGNNRINSKCKECDKKKRVEIRKEKKLQEPHYKILLTLKGRVKIDFKKYGYSKPRGITYEDIIGCDAIVLKEHLEKQFVDGMNWDNHREWEVDHIFPLSKSENQVSYEKNSHYTNLQPLWRKDNRDKSNKII